MENGRSKFLIVFITQVIGFDETKAELEVATENFGKYNTLTIKQDNTLSYDKDHDENFENAFKMGDLNEAALLNLLHSRSLKDKIYTFTGDILLSVNPYMNIPNLYEPMPTSEELKSDDPNASPHLYVLAERTYTALFASGINGTSQAVLINGESGAGKTEAAKRIMAFLMELSQRKKKKQKKKGKARGGRMGYGNAGGVAVNRGRKKPKPKNNAYRGSIQRFADTFKKKKKGEGNEPMDRKQGEIEIIILKTNPIMEAFGNARTIRNDNSSRFGKFVQLEYDKNEIIKGARTRHFLLEKSRVTSHGRGERNYHIFYQMCAAFEADPTNPAFDDLQMLRTYDHYKYLMPTVVKTKSVRTNKRSKRKGSVMRRDGVEKMAERAVAYLKSHQQEIKEEDVRIYKEETAAGFQEIGLELEDQKNIWKALAAILHIGNLQFETAKEPDKYGRLIDVTVVSKDEIDVHGEPKSTIELCAELLGVDVEKLSGALTKKTLSIKGRNSVSETPLTVTEASKSKDGLAKAIYEALFTWMLFKINEATTSAVDKIIAAQSAGGPFGIKKKPKPSAKSKGKDIFIGILDIFGFEMLEDNSFEQLCINYANETLQGMFDAHVFEIEKEAYSADGIDFDTLKLKFRENQPLLDILNKKGKGIFQLMDEQGAVAGGSDAKLFRAIKNMYDRGPRKKKQAGSEERFAGTDELDNEFFYFRINHFAGIVTYTINGMVAKNADHLQADLADLIAIGGMPVKEEELSKEQLKQEKLAKRSAQKPKKRKKQSTVETGGNSFEFLRLILRMRKGNAEAPDENDEEPEKKKGRGRQRKTKKMAKLQSISAIFRKQMTSLQDLLETTDQHFVRCIKPNDLKKPPSEKWDYHMVNAQLRMLGALEMVRVRRQGFPIRTLYEDFLPKYPELCKKWELEWSKGIEDRKACVALMNKVDEGGKSKNWYLGDTKMFLRESCFKKLNDDERAIRELKQEREDKLRRLKERKAREEKENNASIKIQSIWRCYSEKKKFKETVRKIILIQACCRRILYSTPLKKYKLAIIQIQKLARGFLVRTRYKKLGNIAALLTPIAQGYIARKKTNVIFRKRAEYKECLKEGESVVLESECTQDKLKRKDNTTSPKPYSLILTTGPSPRILYVNKLSGIAKAELNWDERVLCGLMANEYKLVIYAKPTAKQDSEQVKAQKNAQNVFKFNFIKPVAALWLLALKGIYSVHDILKLETPDYSKVIKENPGLTVKDIQDHGNMLPLNPKQYTKFIFGGEFIYGGLKKVKKQQLARLNQKTHWRPRFFVLKESTLFWFQTEHSTTGEKIKTGVYPVGGISLSTETTINMASTQPQFFSKQFKQKASLEIESRVLRSSLKLNFVSEKFRQQWVTKMKTAVKSQVKANERKRMSISKGVVDTKAFMRLNAEDLLAPTASEPTLSSEQTNFLLVEDEDVMEDIEQGLVEEIF